MRKKTTEEFKRQIQDINPDIEIIGEYQGNKTKISCRCKICPHEWEAYIDFYLPDHDIFIEYNGRQHYIPLDYFGGILSLEH